MEKRSFNPEEEAELTLKSLDGISRADAPGALDEKIISSIESMRRGKMRPAKWLWVAGIALMLINGAVAFIYLSPSGENQENTAVSAQQSSTISDVGSYYFSEGGAWY
ncbi:MAG TPA: hypothetical protein VFU15_07590 [Bacteroidia bacterium]|nr:hypothetical protein [Bacteroidia bacterium]